MTTPSSPARGTDADGAPGRFGVGGDAATTRPLHEINAAAAAFYAQHLADHRPALDYLRSRGIAHAATSTQWQLGCALPGWRTLVDHLRALGYTDEQTLGAGLAGMSQRRQLVDRFRDRIVFPVHDQQRQVAGFTARDLSGRARAKYLNTPENSIYRKNQLLYGLGVPPDRWTGDGSAPLVVVVEGAADTIAVRAMADALPADGDPVSIWPVSPCGTALTRQQLQALTRAVPNDTPLAMAFDGDAAGRRALERAYPLLRHWPGRTYAILLPEGTDPADLLAAHGPAGAMREHAAELQPAARAALTVRIDRLFADGRITKPQQYVEDRCYAYRAIAGYFIDNPDDTPALAAAAAARFGVDDTEVVRGVIESAFPDGSPADSEPLHPSTVVHAVASERGQRRHQADATATQTDPATGRQSWAVADGIGDLPEAAHAATVAAQTAAREASRAGAVAGIEAARAELNSATPSGDASIIVVVTAPTDDGIGYDLAWAGSARAYTLREEQLVQITVDHTVAQELRDAGRAVSCSSELEHLLTSSVRQGPIGRSRIEPPRASLLLATGGLYRHVPPTHLRQSLDRVRNPQATADRLATTAALRGGNSTVLVLLPPEGAPLGAPARPGQPHLLDNGRSRADTFGGRWG